MSPELINLALTLGGTILGMLIRHKYPNLFPGSSPATPVSPAQPNSTINQVEQLGWKLVQQLLAKEFPGAASGVDKSALLAALAKELGVSPQATPASK